MNIKNIDSTKTIKIGGSFESIALDKNVVDTQFVQDVNYKELSEIIKNFGLAQFNSTTIDNEVKASTRAGLSQHEINLVIDKSLSDIRTKLNDFQLFKVVAKLPAKADASKNLIYLTPDKLSTTATETTIKFPDTDDRNIYYEYVLSDQNEWELLGSIGSDDLVASNNRIEKVENTTFQAASTNYFITYPANYDYTKDTPYYDTRPNNTIATSIKSSNGAFKLTFTSTADADTAVINSSVAVSATNQVTVSLWAPAVTSSEINEMITRIKNK